MKGICRVCELVDKDSRPKPITYCNMCYAWICEECEPNLLKRAKAALIDKLL